MGKIIERVRRRERIAADNRARAEWEARRDVDLLPGGIHYVEPGESMLDWVSECRGIARMFYKKPARPSFLQWVAGKLRGAA